MMGICGTDTGSLGGVTMMAGAITGIGGGSSTSSMLTPNGPSLAH